MVFRTHWFLKRRPCFECADAGTTRFYPWVELMLAVDVEAEIGGYSGYYFVSNDPFASGEEYTSLCPYCLLPDDHDA